MTVSSTNTGRHPASRPDAVASSATGPLAKLPAGSTCGSCQYKDKSEAAPEGRTLTFAKTDPRADCGAVSADGVRWWLEVWLLPHGRWMLEARRVPAHRRDTDAGGYWMSGGEWGVDPAASLPARVEALALMWASYLLGPGPGSRVWLRREIPEGQCMRWRGTVLPVDEAPE